MTGRRPTFTRGLLKDDPGRACDEAVNLSLAISKYDARRFVPRTRLEYALNQFLGTDETLFVLAGMSGTGKSWAAAHWASTTLRGRLRLLLAGADLDHRQTLESLTAHSLRPFTPTRWRNEQILQRLTSAAESGVLGACVVIIDDLIPVGNIGTYRRDLARLVADSLAFGIKLVMTCQRHVWELYSLGAEIPPDDLFMITPRQVVREQYALTARQGAPPNISFTIVPEQKGRDYSYLLSDFTPDELGAALSRHLSEGRAKEVANHLRAPGFTPLRNPYLLTRYLERHRDLLERSDNAPPLDVDALLDWRVSVALGYIAREVTSIPEDVEPAFAALVERLWTIRPRGVSHGEALTALREEFGEQSSEVLTALRKAGLVTIEGAVRLAEPLVADRLYALRARAILRAEEDGFLRDLRVEVDAGLVVALLRSIVPDPVRTAEKLLEQNGSWTSAVMAGLAQSTPDDWRTLAMVTTLATSSEDQAAANDSYAALGQLAVRGDRARKWVADMYLGDHAKKWRRGGRALARAMEYDPPGVEAAVRTRLSRIQRINETFSSDRNKRVRLLTNNALDPLRDINHLSAAITGERIINRYLSLAGEDDEDDVHDRDWGFVSGLDDARGRIALFGEARHMDALLALLSSQSSITRFRAAEALRPVVIERPEAARDTLCTRLVDETSWDVMKRLLLAAYHLIDFYPDELLASLRRGRMFSFRASYAAAGQVLVLLGNLAGKRPNDVAGLLPPHLDAHEAWSRAFLSEILAYAWWRCSEHVPEARSHLTALTELDLADVPDNHYPFAVRGCAIAVLAEMCLDQGIPADELTGRQVFYPNADRQFVYVETIEFFQNHASLIRQHDSFERFEQLLIRCLHEEERVQDHPIQPIREAQFRCASMCLELLARSAVLMPDPLPLLNALPRNWQGIRAATRLLEMGRTEEAVVRFARESFAGLERGGTMQAVEERRRCQAQLALLEENAEQALSEQRESALDFLFFQSTGNALGLSVHATKHPDKLLAHIDANVRTEKDLPTLYYLVEEARSWQSLLIARIYARMFNTRPISLREAGDLCEQMLAALRALPDSTLQREYVAIYGSIARLLGGGVAPFLHLPPLPADTTKSVLRNAHELTYEILHQTPTVPADFSRWLADQRGWWETPFFELRDSFLLQGTANYQMYFFPAVRLALAAVAGRHNLTDPAARLMQERWETHERLRDHLNLLNYDDLEEYPPDLIEYALTAFNERSESTPQDERVYCWLGGLLLRLNRLEEAEEMFQRSLSLPTSHGDIRLEALDNLACVYARQNNEAKCRRTLEERARIEPLDRAWLARDPDLESVRETEWFQPLLTPEEAGGSATDGGNQGDTNPQ